MNAISINDTIAFSDKHNVIKTFLYIKLCEKEYKMSDKDYGILALFADSDDKESVINEALGKKYVKSYQSGDNCVTRFVNLGLLLKIGKKRRKVNPEYFPDMNGDMVICKLSLYNAQ